MHFASKLHGLLNSHDFFPAESILDSVSTTVIAFIELSSECIFDVLRPSKSDGSVLLSDHVIHAASVFAPLLSDLCTATVRHGFMPESLRDCTLVPILSPWF